MGKGSGGGGLRILPHKSWNVWNGDNIARVERDEQRHVQQQKHQQQRERLTQHTQRINTLRHTSLPSHDDEQLAEEGLAVAAEEKSGGGVEVRVSGQQSFGQFAVESGQPWYVRGELEKNARSGRQERAQVEQQQQRSRAEAVLQRIRKREEEERKEETRDSVGRHVQLAELLGSEKKGSDDPLDVMRYYVQRTKEQQRLHEILPDSPPPHTSTPPHKRERSQQTVEVIELSSGGDSDRDSHHRDGGRRRDKQSRRHRARPGGRRHDEGGEGRGRKKRKGDMGTEDDEKRRAERRAQIIELLGQLDGKQST